MADDPSTQSVVSKEEWLSKRLEHLAAEKEFTRRRDALSAARRALPWTEITNQYKFETTKGTKTLHDLFGGKGQLIIYHFMMGPGEEAGGCPSCSWWADNFEGNSIHLAHRDTALVAVSHAPLSEIEAYKKRMGWTFEWVSSYDSSFNYDFGVSFSKEQLAVPEKPRYNLGTKEWTWGAEAPGISVFSSNALVPLNSEAEGGAGEEGRNKARVFLTYQTFGRGLDMLNGAYHMLDLTPKGRNEEGLPYTMAWLRRHDSYEDETSGKV